MARVNVDILGISELKWTRMGEFNSDDHYIYYCEQESLRRNGVATMVNKRVQNAVLGCNLKNDRMISVHFQGKPFNRVVEDNTEESKKAPKPKSGNFDAAAKSAEKASQSKAESNKKFSEESKNQRKAEVLKGFMRSLAVDQKTKDAAEAVCTRIDKHFKIKTTSK